ncbi:coproporphyrinogen III oxidase family protein [Chloroflexota bacterium]
MLPNIVGYVTRNEGKKFLKLSDKIDEGIINGAAIGADNNIALYVHIPFCKHLCPFCCFNRYPLKEESARKYFLSLRKEVELYIDKGYNFSHFYFGGGTPTVMMEELIDFLSYLHKQFTVKEISLETNPADVNNENIRLLQRAGVNRLSIGVQSFDNEVLKSMGRTHCPGEEIKERLPLAEGNFDTVNVDLVYNFPSQSLEQFESDIATVKDLGIDQITFYPLMASPHKKNAMERRFNRIDMAREQSFYDIILRDIYAEGYKASTAWCFSNGERIIDEYIIDFDDYIGVGAGSVSIVKGNLYINSFSLDNYEGLINSGQLPIIRWRELSERENLRYYLLTKLFGMKLDKEKFSRRFHGGINNKLLLEMLFLKMTGIVQENENISVTDRGMYPVSTMMREFFTGLNSLREFCIEKQI